jgi:hypothetical protein
VYCAPALESVVPARHLYYSRRTGDRGDLPL